MEKKNFISVHNWVLTIKIDLRVVVIIVAIAAALLGLYWSVVGIVALAKLFWGWSSKWWLLGGLGLALLVWLLTKVKWPKRQPRQRKEFHAPKWLWWLLGVLLLIFLVFMLFRSCGKENIAPEPAPAPIVTPDRYEAAQDWIILDAYLSEGFNIKYADYQRFEAYGQKLSYQERIAAFGESDSYRDWGKLFPYFENKPMTDNQLAALTRYGLWCGLAGFEKSPVCNKLMKGKTISADDLAFVYTSTGNKRTYSSTANEVHAKKYAWVLMSVYDGNLTIDELRDFPVKSYESIPLEEMYDKDGRYIFNQSLKDKLATSDNRTTREVLEL